MSFLIRQWGVGEGQPVGGRFVWWWALSAGGLRTGSDRWWPSAEPSSFHWAEKWLATVEDWAHWFRGSGPSLITMAGHFIMKGRHWIGTWEEVNGSIRQFPEQHEEPWWGRICWQFSVAWEGLDDFTYKKQCTYTTHGQRRVTVSRQSTKIQSERREIAIFGINGEKTLKCHDVDITWLHVL